MTGPDAAEIIASETGVTRPLRPRHTFDALACAAGVVLAATVALLLSPAAAGQLAEGSTLMADYAAGDAAWTSATSFDTLTYEEWLAEPPGAAHYLARGFNTRQQVDMTQSEIDHSLNEMARTGADVHRLLVYWADIQPNGSGEWAWRKYDRVVKSAAAHGLRLVLAPTGSPNWARVPERWTNPADVYHPFPYPDDLGAWDVFVRELAVRYAPYAPAFEIWNEPNLRRFWEARPLWSARGPSPSGWNELYCRARSMIKAIIPTAPVGTGGLAAQTVQGWHWRAAKFMKRAFEVGLSDCGLDFVGYHAYAIDAFCNGSEPAMDGSLPAFRELAAVRGVMNQNGHAERAVWNTEWGFPSATCASTEHRQASLIVREHGYLRTLPYVSRSIYFNQRDDGSNTRWGRVGVLRLDWSPKRALSAFASLP